MLATVEILCLEDNSAPFRSPVDADALGIPVRVSCCAFPQHAVTPPPVVQTYHDVIQRPMDFETLRDLIETNAVHTWVDFVALVRLIFNNCHKFNCTGTKCSPICAMGRQIEAQFDRLHSEAVARGVHKRAIDRPPSPHPPSPHPPTPGQVGPSVASADDTSPTLAAQSDKDPKSRAEPHEQADGVSPTGHDAMPSPAGRSASLPPSSAIVTHLA